LYPEIKKPYPARLISKYSSGIRKQVNMESTLLEVLVFRLFPRHSLPVKRKKAEINTNRAKW
jgi:hypothetical protein